MPPVELTDGNGGGEGGRPKSYEGEKAWSSIIHYILSATLWAGVTAMTDGCVPVPNSVTAAGDYISTHLCSSCQGNRYGTEKAGGTASPSRTKSHLLSHSLPASQVGRRVGLALYTFGLIGPSFHLELVLARF